MSVMGRTFPRGRGDGKDGAGGAGAHSAGERFFAAAGGASGPPGGTTGGQAGDDADEEEGLDTIDWPEEDTTPTEVDPTKRASRTREDGRQGSPPAGPGRGQENRPRGAPGQPPPRPPSGRPAPPKPRGETKAAADAGRAARPASSPGEARGGSPSAPAAGDAPAEPPRQTRAAVAAGSTGTSQEGAPAGAKAEPRGFGGDGGGASPSPPAPNQSPAGSGASRGGSDRGSGSQRGGRDARAGAPAVPYRREAARKSRIGASSRGEVGRGAPDAAGPAPDAAGPAPDAAGPAPDGGAEPNESAREGGAASEGSPPAPEASTASEAKRAGDARVPARPKTEPDETRAGGADDAADVERAVAALETAPAAGGQPAGSPESAGQPSPAEEDSAGPAALFDQLAPHYLSHVRELMLELRWGRVLAEWLEMAEPTVRSLQGMAEQVEKRELGAALEGLADAMARAREGGGEVQGERREDLLRAFAPVEEAAPAALAAEGERDRREPWIVRGVLLQVEGVDTVALDKLGRAGLFGLATLRDAKAGELAEAAGISDALADRIAGHIAHELAGAGALATPNRGEELERLRERVAELEAAHAEYESAAAGWSADARARKRRARRRRFEAALRVQVSLARLGEIDRIAAIDRLPHAKKIEALTAFVGAEEGKPHG